MFRKRAQQAVEKGIFTAFFAACALRLGPLRAPPRREVQGSGQFSRRVLRVTVNLFSYFEHFSTPARRGERARVFAGEFIDSDCRTESVTSRLKGGALAP
jgi:hypothetical protein